jgi:hypothetical protein
MRDKKGSRHGREEEIICCSSTACDGRKDSGGNNKEVAEEEVENINRGQEGYKRREKRKGGRYLLE